MERSSIVSIKEEITTIGIHNQKCPAEAIGMPHGNLQF